MDGKTYAVMMIADVVARQCAKASPCIVSLIQPTCCRPMTTEEIELRPRGMICPKSHS